MRARLQLHFLGGSAACFAPTQPLVPHQVERTTANDGLEGQVDCVGRRSALVSTCSAHAALARAPPPQPRHAHHARLASQCAGQAHPATPPRGPPRPAAPRCPAAAAATPPQRGPAALPPGAAAPSPPRSVPGSARRDVPSVQQAGTTPAIGRWWHQAPQSSEHLQQVGAGAVDALLQGGDVEPHRRLQHALQGALALQEVGLKWRHARGEETP